MTLLHVPVIDLTPYRDGTPEGKAAVAAQIGQACRDIGFLVVSGHGIPDALVRRTHAVSEAFFALPHGDKLKADRPAPDQVRGYSAVGGEGLSFSLDEPTSPDIKESLSIGPVDVPADDPYFTGADAGPHFAPNVWPAEARGAEAGLDRVFQGRRRARHEPDAAVRSGVAAPRGSLRRDHRQEHLDDAGAALSPADHGAAPRPAPRRRPFRLRQHDHPEEGDLGSQPRGEEQGRRLGRRPRHRGLHSSSTSATSCSSGPTTPGPRRCTG